LKDDGTFLDLGTSRELAEVVEDEEGGRRELWRLATVAEGEGQKRWNEQRRLASRGLIGGVWKQLLREAGVRPDKVRALCQKLMEATGRQGSEPDAESELIQEKTSSSPAKLDLNQF
jgi:hypothetical protein